MARGSKPTVAGFVCETGNLGRKVTAAHRFHRSLLSVLIPPYCGAGENRYREPGLQDLANTKDFSSLYRIDRVIKGSVPRSKGKGKASTETGQDRNRKN